MIAVKSPTKRSYKLRRDMYEVFVVDDNENRAFFDEVKDQKQTFIEVKFGALKGETFMIWTGQRAIKTHLSLTITVDYRVQSKMTSQIAEARQGSGANTGYWRCWQIPG